MDLENVKTIYALKQEKTLLEKQMEEAKARIEDIDTEVSRRSTPIIEELKNNNKQEYTDKESGLIITLFSKSNVGYTDDKAVITWLKDNGYNQYIKTKVTETLDKNPLKKDMKTDTKLAEQLASMTVTTVSEYITVQDEDTHKRMIEHIEKNKEDK